MPSLPIRCSFRGLVLSLALGAAAGAASAEEGALSQLYAARPPAGSSFVRVVNPSPAPFQVRVAEGPVQRIGGEVPATSYAIVAGGRKFTVQVDGKEVSTYEATRKPYRDSTTPRFTVHFGDTEPHRIEIAYLHRAPLHHPYR